VDECSATNWIAPQDPCLKSNAISVTTDTTGAFSHRFAVKPCSAALVATCYVGSPIPTGVDTISLAGAARVTGP
jgi:hypothetical protein